jgi:hypothetical protein
MLLLKFIEISIGLFRRGALNGVYCKRKTERSINDSLFLPARPRFFLGVSAMISALIKKHAAESKTRPFGEI